MHPILDKYDNDKWFIRMLWALYKPISFVLRGFTPCIIHKSTRVYMLMDFYSIIYRNIILSKYRNMPAIFVFILSFITLSSPTKFSSPTTTLNILIIFSYSNDRQTMIHPIIMSNHPNQICVPPIPSSSKVLPLPCPIHHH